MTCEAEEYAMPHMKINKPMPAGQMPLDDGDRKPIFRFVSGDTWKISVNLYNPANSSEPATPDNTVATVTVAETQFDKALWTGEWYNGIMPDEKRPGLCYIVIPPDVTDSLRRGSYMFSVKVSDKLCSVEATEADGSFLVEYKPTSENHSIPYKDGDGRADNIPTIVEMLNDAFKRLDEKKVDKTALAGKDLSTSTINGLREAMYNVAKVLGARIEWPKE